MTTDRAQHRVVIIGGGFGGLTACRYLKRANVRITLVDRRNFHLFQPLLYQVATGGLSPANIASPIRGILKRQRNAEVLLGEVVGIDAENRRVLLTDGEIPYDTLIVATGTVTSYFGHDHWEQVAPGLKSLEEATEIRRRVLLAFETAERLTDQLAVRDDAPPGLRKEIAPWLTFVVVGGGPTGVELAGAIAGLARGTLPRDFRRIDTTQARVLLVEGGDRVLGAYPPKLCENARHALERLGVTVRTSCLVTDIQPSQVTISQRQEDGSRTEETILTYNTFWAAGVRASPLGTVIAQAIGAETDRMGRIIVQPDCSIPGHPEIFVIGDLAHYNAGTPEKPEILPGLAPVAIQQGKYVAKVIRRRLERRPPPPFKYRDKGSMATIGRGHAVAQLGRLRMSGVIAWLAWLFVHLMYLVTFYNRLLVLFQWGWSYFTRNRSARLITGQHLLPQLGELEHDAGVRTAAEPPSKAVRPT